MLRVGPPLNMTLVSYGIVGQYGHFSDDTSYKLKHKYCHGWFMS